MSFQSELVVLVDDNGVPIGSVEKSSVHTYTTPLHLAFSCHVFNSVGQVLVTRRALSKATWPGVWTNSFCGHPAPGESLEDAIKRRAQQELGITVTDIRPLLPNFRYTAIDASGVVENEICPVFTAVTNDEPRPEPNEIAEFRWVASEKLVDAVESTPFAFSPWVGWQLAEVRASGADYAAAHPDHR